MSLWGNNSRENGKIQLTIVTTKLQLRYQLTIGNRQTIFDTDAMKFTKVLRKEYTLQIVIC